MVPMKMSQVVMRWSSRLALTTNTARPSGGVSRPISMAMMLIRPSQTRLTPNASNTGITNGKTISMIETESRKQPSTSSTTR
jgi:hypothetical protein